jgi:carbon-monoxide dehydrogenase iron sulfur subunit
MKKLLFYNPDPCTGCLNCVMTCAQERGGSAGPAVARIRIDIDIFGGPHAISVCRQCEKAACAEACPEGAIVRNPESEAWIIDKEKCVSCLTCVDACPFNALFVHPENGSPLKCDLCGGRPRCAEACAFGALRFGDADDESLQRLGIPEIDQDPLLGKGPPNKPGAP